MKIMRVISLFFFFAGAGVVVLPLAFDAALLFIYQQGHEAITRMHLRFVPDVQFNEKLDMALNEEDIDLANQIVEIGMDHNVTFSADLLERLIEENGTLKTITRNSQQVWHGASTGDAISGYALTGILAKDVTGVTDFQELLKELELYPNHNSLNLGISFVGVFGTTLTAVGFVTSGASAAAGAPLRALASIFRVVKTSGRFSKKLEKVFAGHIDNVINQPAVADFTAKFKKINFEDLDVKQVDELQGLAKKTVNLKAAGPLFDSVNDMKAITSNAGVAGLSRSLSAADDLADLNRLSKLSKVTKSKYAGHITLAPELAKSVYKVLSILMQAIAFLLSAVLWLIGIIWYCVKIVKFLFFRSAVVAS